VAIRRRYLALIGLRWFQTGLLIPVITLLMVSRGLSLVEIGLAASVHGLMVLALGWPAWSVRWPLRCTYPRFVPSGRRLVEGPGGPLLYSRPVSFPGRRCRRDARAAFV